MMSKDLKKLIDGFSEKEAQIIDKAYKFAQKYHGGQKRLSGRPYFSHLYETALILKNLDVDNKTIAAGLLHDVTEDGLTNEETVKKEFGEEIAFLVDGVTKLGKIRFRGAKRHIESLRKLFIFTAKDIRVLLIKLADRLHNMKTLDYIETKIKRKRIALETMEVYAPIAHRLSIGKLKGELEDLAFKYINKKEYIKVKKILEEKEKKNVELSKEIYDSLKNRLQKENVDIKEINYRQKHIYSLYKKLLSKNMNIDDIHDIFAFRIITSDIASCYKILGIVHNIWTPLPGRIKDYVASPKPNGYQSIHTSIFTGKGTVVEIQIRTKEMHEEAEYGIASHVSYSEKLSKKSATKNLLLFKKISSLINNSKHSILKNQNHKEELHPQDTPKWIKDLAETQEKTSAPKEFMENLKNDFFENRIFVFTPNGDVIDLPYGATPLDFAYHIHSDIGNHSTGAKINNRFVSLDTKLQHEDIVEIIIKKNNHPTQKWLNIVKTTLAKKSIKQYLQKK